MMIRPLLLFLLLSLFATDLNAQFRKKKKREKTEETKSKESSALLKSAKQIDGLFLIYRDTTNGKAFLAIKKEQLEKEFIYFSYTENAPIWAGQVRGMFQTSKVFHISKHYDRLEFTTPNTSYYYNEFSALSRAANANISEAIWASLKIEETQGDSLYIVNADELFLSEKIDKIKPYPPAKKGGSPRFDLGKMSKEKSKYVSFNNYPENTEVQVDYVFENPSPQNFGGTDISDARYVTIRYQHSFLQAPDDGYQARWDDPRVGFFMTKVTNMTSDDITPYRDMIHRWRLEKKDPTAQLSKPVTPITYWIENTTPKELRTTIKEAALKWNYAFEKAGFIDAIEVKIQPDDADWDAGDIRYNVLRWTSSPIPPWGGYGPSFVNPRTGEILGADIMLEYSSIKGDRIQADLVAAAAYGIDDLIEDTNELAALDALHGKSNSCSKNCGAGMAMLLGNGMGAAYLRGSESDRLKDRLLRESLSYLVLHEVGHTLGLMHNMKASQLYSVEEAHDLGKTQNTGLYGSVMDYPSINLSTKKWDQGQFYTDRPGPYDLWAIEFGYKPELSDFEKRRVVLERSTEVELAFGNDADDMRSPGRGIDPRIMIFDMTNEPIKFATNMVEVSDRVITDLLSKRKENDYYDEIYRMYRITHWYRFGNLNAASRYIGGVYQDRSTFGQVGAEAPLRPVPIAEQKAAMNLLGEALFAPDAWDNQEELYPYLNTQRRGFDHWGKSESPQLHKRFRVFPVAVLRHLLHPNTLARLTDTELFGNEYSCFEMMNDLSGHIFNSDLNSTVNSYRQNLQVDYMNMLLHLISEKSSADPVAKSAVLYQIETLRTRLKGNMGTASTKAHRMQLLHLIKKGLEE